MRHGRVAAIDDLSPRFRVLTLEGTDLKNVSWTPGDKIQIQLGGWTQRTYTPMNWDPANGTTQILVYMHGQAPGSEWARAVQVGGECVFFGPRGSLNLPGVRGPAVLFGDETSLGVAAAFKFAPAHRDGTMLLFEFFYPEEARPVMEYLGLEHCHWVSRQANDEHINELATHLGHCILGPHPQTVVLTGRLPAIQELRRRLRAQAFPASQLQNRVYWAPGKAGLD
jgi:NADPH-dependent ferric siderophore reductase